MDEKKKSDVITVNIDGIEFSVYRWMVQLYGKNIQGLKHIINQKFINDQLMNLKISKLKAFFKKQLINGPVLGVKNKYMGKIEQDAQKYREILSLMFIKLVVDKVTAQYNLSFINATA